MIDDHVSSPRREGQAFYAAWLLTTPWAHRFWSQYFWTVTDLTTPMRKPPVLVRPGMTHELLVFAVDPTNGRTEKLGGKWPPVLLPGNHGYQFKAEDDEAASIRVALLVGAVEAEKLSPDTDFTPAWDKLFADGASLKVNMLKRALAVVQ